MKEKSCVSDMFD